jgi:hypothetical protein
MLLRYLQGCRYHNLTSTGLEFFIHYRVDDDDDDDDDDDNKD